MGKKPVVGLGGLLVAGLALCGCQESRLCGPKCGGSGLASNNKGPSMGGVQQAGLTNPPGSGPVYSPGTTFSGPGARPGSATVKPSDIVPTGSTGRPLGGAPTSGSGMGLSEPAPVVTPPPGGSSNFRSGMSPSPGMSSSMDTGMRSVPAMPVKPMPGVDSVNYRTAPTPSVGSGMGSGSLDLPAPPPPPAPVPPLSGTSGSSLDSSMGAPSGNWSSKSSPAPLPDLPPPSGAPVKMNLNDQ